MHESSALKRRLSIKSKLLNKCASSTLNHSQYNRQFNSKAGIAHVQRKLIYVQRIQVNQKSPALQRQAAEQPKPQFDVPFTENEREFTYFK